MENKEIASVFKLVGQLMEIHGENKFKARSYGNAAFQIGKFASRVEDMDSSDLGEIPGIGKNLVPKLEELIASGEMSYLQNWLEKTPDGIVEMLRIKGLGPGKIRTIWQEMELESVGELLYACNENRLVDLKGFGAKTQQQVKESIEFIMDNKNRFLYASVEPLMLDIKEWVEDKYPQAIVSETGAMLRRDPIVEVLEMVVTDDAQEFPETSTNKVDVRFYQVPKEQFEEEVLKRSFPEVEINEGLAKAVPEMRNVPWASKWLEKHESKELITDEDLKGCLHNHSTYSDGIDKLKNMAEHLEKEGYEYFGISDHSKTAVYAGGLTEAQIEQQHKEVDQLNEAMMSLQILKGIESDILPNGKLDYSDDVLDTFDFVVASVHSALKMDEETATERLIKAVEHPATRILGHPTGRLLLSRPAYPIDHEKVIDACAANNVAIELNANPMRLDIDYKWIPYCMEKEVMVSINPDAHRIAGFDHMRYGVMAARKGGLVKSMCLNALSREEVSAFFARK